MSKKQMILIGVTAVICIASLIFMLVALLQEQETEIRFTPPPFDEAAVVGVPALTEEDGYRSLDAQVYRVALCGSLTLTPQNTVDVWLTNVEENQAWLKMVIYDTDGNKLGESGLIRSGEYVQSIQLTTPPTQSTDVSMIIMGYEPETYYSIGNVTLQTEILVGQ